jgi:hypothetical protein
MGPRYEMPAHLVPSKSEWQKVASGNSFAVWEKKA